MTRPATSTILAVAAVLAAHLGQTATSQPQAEPYAAVLSLLGKPGDVADGVLKINLPRTDLRVTIAGRPAPTPFGFGGWVALTTAPDGVAVLMGDLVLTEDEVTPVLSALLEQGLEVTALHNHFFREQPRIFYLHLHGVGAPADLARRLRPALDLIDRMMAAQPAVPATEPSRPDGLDTAALSRIIGYPGEASGPVFKITVGRPDLDVREHGARIGTRMGLNTWAAFAGRDADAMVAGDVAMLEHEVTPVVKALRAHGLEIVALHHHMIGVQPLVVFLHYYGTGPAARLAAGVRAALDLLGQRRAPG